MTTKTVIVETEADVTALWRTAMNDIEFAHRQLWYVFADEDGELLPVLNSVDDLPREPDFDLLDNLGWVMRKVRDRHTMRGRIAVLMTRPGRGSLNKNDAQWVRAIEEMLLNHSLFAWPTHFGNAAYLKRVMPDDIV
jgi:hypothetical protein